MDKKPLLETLIAIGFSDREALVYLTLLELNEALPSVISRLSGVKRPTTYQILEELEKRGLVSHIKRKNLLFFQACRPEHLIKNQKAQFEETKKQLDLLEKSLPELNKLHQDFTATPQMSVFKGKEGLIQIMEDTLTTKTELLCWADIELAAFTVLQDYYPTYIKKKVQKKIWLKGIFPYDEKSKLWKARSKRELREIYLIPKEKFPFENEINIYDDKVSIISHEDQVGIIIQNAHIANTQRSIFNLAFEYAKILDERNKN